MTINEPHPDLPTDSADSQSTGNLLQRMPQRTRLALFTVGALALTGGVGSTFWYTHQGFKTSAAPTADAFAQAVRTGEHLKAYDLLTARSRESLSLAQFKQLTPALQPLFNHGPESPLNVVKDSGWFIRGATLTLPSVNPPRTTDGRTINPPPLRLQLESAEWRVVATALYAHAMVHALPQLENMIPRGNALDDHFKPGNGIDKAAAAQRKQADEVLASIQAWAQSAKAFDPTFRAENVLARADELRKMLDPALNEATRRAKIATARSNINATLDQAEALYWQDSNGEAAALFEQVLANGNATNAQRALAEDFLNRIGREGVASARRAALEQAGRLYDRAQHQEAIAELQELLSHYDLSPELRGRANYLLSFAYRDFKDAPNNMQNSIEAARAATEAQPGNGEYWCTLGDRLRQYNVHGESTRSFLRGISLLSDPVSKSNCYVWYGWNLYADGDYWAARDAWQTSLALNPTNADALRAINN